MGAIQSILQSKYDHDISIHYLLLETIGSFPLQSEVNKMELKENFKPLSKMTLHCHPLLTISINQIPNPIKPKQILFIEHCDVEEVESG